MNSVIFSINEKILTQTSLDFSWQEQYDASKMSAINFHKPTEILFRLLNLNYSKTEGQLLNQKGEMICFDPCTVYPTYSCLLIRKDDLIEKLRQNGLDIFWTIVGEKRIMGRTFTAENYQGSVNISGIVEILSDRLVYTPSFFIE